MIAAASRPSKSLASKLLVVDAEGCLQHAPRSRVVDFFKPGDLVIANDAATLPASLPARHAVSGADIEVRLASRRSLAPEDVTTFTAVIFGAGNFRTPTERRPLPPPLAPGDRLTLGPLSAVVVELLGHSRLAVLRFEGSPDSIWAGIARHGSPIQYTHVPGALALWDVWTAIAGRPVAFEPPSAGFILDWRMLQEMRRRGVGFATLTHAAGISSTGDEELDARLPFDEPYEIPERTAAVIAEARTRGARVVAIGTTVVRALEHAALASGLVRPGPGIATQRIGPETELHAVDAIVTGIHEPGTSHYELLRAFADDGTLRRAQHEMIACGYRTHEFGDSALIERRRSSGGAIRLPPAAA